MGADWRPVVVVVMMFILLSLGLLFQLLARTRVIEFVNMYTSGIAVLHAILCFLKLIDVLPLKEGWNVCAFVTRDLNCSFCPSSVCWRSKFFTFCNLFK